MGFKNYCMNLVITQVTPRCRYIKSKVDYWIAEIIWMCLWMCILKRKYARLLLFLHCQFLCILYIKVIAMSFSIRISMWLLKSHYQIHTFKCQKIINLSILRQFIIIYQLIKEIGIYFHFSAVNYHLSLSFLCRSSYKTLPFN